MGRDTDERAWHQIMDDSVRDHPFKALAKSSIFTRVFKSSSFFETGSTPCLDESIVPSTPRLQKKSVTKFTHSAFPERYKRVRSKFFLNGRICTSRI